MLQTQQIPLFALHGCSFCYSVLNGSKIHDEGEKCVHALEMATPRTKFVPARTFLDYMRNCARVEVRTKHGRCSGSRWRRQDTFTAQPRSPRGTKPAMIGRLILSSSGRVGPNLLCAQGSGCLFPSLITHLCFCIGLTWSLRF